MPKPKITPDIADQVLERMRDGEILTAICREYDLRPSAFSNKAERDPEFGERYARARKEQAHAMAMDVVRIADEEPDPQRARVRCDARKWVAARIDPKNYGDRATNEIVGAGGGPVELAVLTAAERAERAAALIDDAFTALPKLENGQ